MGIGKLIEMLSKINEPCSEYALNALAIDEPLEYVRLYFKGWKTSPNPDHRLILNPSYAKCIKFNFFSNSL